MVLCRNCLVDSTQTHLMCFCRGVQGQEFGPELVHKDQPTDGCVCVVCECVRGLGLHGGLSAAGGGMGGWGLMQL